MTWKSGIDGGTWFYCSECKVSTPPTDQGECYTCGTVIVPQEPPDADGEDFRGGEAAAYEREQCAEWQSLK